MRNRCWAVLVVGWMAAGCGGPSCVGEECAEPCAERDCGLGTCLVGVRGAFCECPAGMHEEDETCVESPADCAGVDCGAHGSCELVGGRASCRCDEGYVASGLSCVEVGDPCAAADCGAGRCVAEGASARCECPEGQHAIGLRCAEDTPIDDSGVFVTLPETGSVSVALHPDASVVGREVWVSFGVPFPRGALRDVGMLTVTDADDREITAHVEELARWRNPREASQESIRAVRVSFQRTLASADPPLVYVHWGRPPTASLPSAPAAWESWIGPVGEYPSADDVREPAVYATLPPAWLGAALLRTRSLPLDESAGLGWLDALVPRFSETAVNDVDPRVTEANRIDVTTYEPWLFDRASTLFTVYARTGDVRWLRHAHRAAQFYARHVNARGYFDLRDGDLKYSYGASMLTDLMLTGDTRLREPIARVGAAGESFEPRYAVTTNFWTERHLAYALLAAVTAWEASGEARFATRIAYVIDTMIAHVASPPGGWTPQGCLLHTMRAHEGSSSEQPICSPWMSALLADALFRYYLLSEDARALELLAGLGDFVAEHGLYDGGDESSHLAGVMVPWYLVSNVYQFTDSGAFADLEHTCDVAGLVARGAWATRRLGRDPARLVATTESLLGGCRRNLENWVRPGGPDAGLSVYRLSPPRKYNWWFGTTSDLTFFLDVLGR